MHCPLSGFALTQQFVLIWFLGWWWICGLWKQNGEDSGGNTQSPALMVHCMCKENVYSQGNYWYIDHVVCYNSMCENHLFVNEIHLEGVYMLISWSEPIIFLLLNMRRTALEKILWALLLISYKRELKLYIFLYEFWASIIVGHLVVLTCLLVEVMNM